MGRWGGLLFEGDTDFDVASDISADAGIELYNYEIENKKEDSDEFYFDGKGLEVTREHLNSGVFDELFKEYKNDRGSIFRMVILAALAMRIGATIPQQHMTFLRVVAGRKEGWWIDTMKKQFALALKHYKNDGSIYDFHAIRCEDPGCHKANDELEAGQKLSKCDKCRCAFYCGTKCQANHWLMHKETCEAVQGGDMEFAMGLLETANDIMAAK